MTKPLIISAPEPRSIPLLFRPEQEALLREHEVDLKTNGYWRGTLSFYLRMGFPLERALTFDARLKGITMKQVTDAAAAYYGKANYLEAVLYPEGETNEL